MPAHRHDFGKYKLLRRIAAGGMGEVHLAKLVGPSGFEKLVVIKRLLQSRQAEQKYVDMFFAEARVAAQLGHSNIVQVYEVGTIEEVPYIAMEYVHGKSLRKVLDRAQKRPTTLAKEGIPPGFIAHIISQLCMGLAFAHDARHMSGATIGLVHRDINPHNVLISYQGEIKIIDFGIAKSELTSDQTQAGTIKGTVVYMSPEQSLGEKLDKRSDLFSVGICLYEALTGKNPFHKSGMGASLEAIRLAEFPAVDAERKELAPFVPIVAHALAKSRNDRYSDCAQLAEALRKLIEAGDVQKPPVSLATYMAELFGQEMLEEEQLLERTDMVRNPLIVSGLMRGTQPAVLAQQNAQILAQAPEIAGRERLGDGATQADMSVSEPTVATAQKIESAVHSAVTALPQAAAAKPIAPVELSKGPTPNPLLVLMRPLWPSGHKLMEWAHSLGERPTIRKFWPYIGSFVMVFSVMGTIALVTDTKPKHQHDARLRTHAALNPNDVVSDAGLEVPNSDASNPDAVSSSPPASPMPESTASAEQNSAQAGDDSGENGNEQEISPAAERRTSRRRNHSRSNRSEAQEASSGSQAGPRLQIRAEPPLTIQYENAVVDESGTHLKTITGTLKVGQNPSSDSFIITVNYRLTPKGISYQIDSTPWAEVSGPGGVSMGRTPLSWTDPSALLSLEFTNPHTTAAQRLMLRLMR